MQQPMTYLVVADSSQALIYLTDKKLEKLQLVEHENHPTSRLTNSELDSDKAGGATSAGRGFHSLGGDSNSHQEEAADFALRLCRHLHSEHLAGKFKQLLIAAPPHFLGDLRHHLSTDCQKVLGKTVNKNLTRASEKAIIEHFAQES
jgi:protein required for attachment to host cells